jgi:hypothetical protein
MNDVAALACYVQSIADLIHRQAVAEAIVAPTPLEMDGDSDPLDLAPTPLEMDGDSDPLECFFGGFASNSAELEEQVWL